MLTKNEPPTFVCFDPGLQTGVSIYNADGTLKLSSEIIYDTAKPFILMLEKIKEFHNVAWAIIERFEMFSGPARKNAFKCQTQVQILQEVFPAHFTIIERQWNKERLTKQQKKDRAGHIVGRKIDTEHEADAILIGNNTWNSQVTVLQSETWDAFKFLASKPEHKWPSKAEPCLYTQWDNYKRQLQSKI